MSNDTSGEFLGDRRKALEEAFFLKQERELRERLRQQTAEQALREGLAAASGIKDQAVLDRLVALGLGADAVAALTLVPLVEVAWADGSIDAKERAAVLAAAAESGLGEGSAAYELLAGWLAARPAPSLREAWRDYAVALATTLDEAGRAELRRELLGRARAVAAAAGGFLGLGNKVSSAEEAVLADLEQALS